MSHHNTTFHQFLNPLARYEFEGLAKQRHVSHKMRSASRWDQFIGMAMSQLSVRQSLLDIHSNLEAQQHKLHHLDASSLDLSLKRFPWAAYREETANVKLSVGLNHATDIPEFVVLSDGSENGMVEGRKIAFPKGSIVAFNIGYVD